MGPAAAATAARALLQRMESLHLKQQRRKPQLQLLCLVLLTTLRYKQQTPQSTCCLQLLQLLRLQLLRMQQQQLSLQAVTVCLRLTTQRACYLLSTMWQLKQRHTQLLQQLRAHVRQTSQLTTMLPQQQPQTAAQQPTGSQISPLALSAQQQQQQHKTCPAALLRFLLRL
jgi:hypothetical protein